MIVIGGRTPYGFQYKSEPHKGWLVIDEAEAKAVQQISAWILDGWTCYAIARTLYEQHILTRGDLHDAVVKKAQPGAWSPSTIRRIIVNETNKGIWHFGKTRRQKVNRRIIQRSIPKEEWIAVRVPPIVDEATWNLAQVRLAENKRESKRNLSNRYLLRGLVFCRCRRWTGRYKNYLKRAHYRCPKTEASRWMGFCDMPGDIRQDKLANAVWTTVAEALLNPDNLCREVARRRAEAASRMEGKQVRPDAIGKDLAEVDRKRHVLLDQVMVQDFPQSLVQGRQQEWLARRKQLLVETNQIQVEMIGSEPTPEAEEGLVQFAKHIQAGLQQVDFEAKRKVLELLKVRVDVISQKQVKLSTLIPFGQDVMVDNPLRTDNDRANGSVVSTLF